MHDTLEEEPSGWNCIVGEINLGGFIEPVHKPVSIVEMTVEKQASAILMPVSCRGQLIDISDDMATKVDVQFYLEARDALLKAITDFMRKTL